MDTGTGAITTIHFAIIVVLAILTVIVIAWGSRLKRARVAAAREFAAHEEDRRDATTREQADLGDDPPQEPARVGSDPRAASQSQSQSQPVAASAPLAANLAADRPVTILKGLGPKVATTLADRGITTVGQMAALDAAEAEALDAGLGPFRDRMARDRWVEQARFLAAGDDKGFEAVFGRL